MVSEWFEFDGTTSLSKNLAIVNTSGGVKNLPYLPSQNIIEDKTPNSNTPYFYKRDMSPLSFSITMSLIGEDWTISKKKEIAEWLYKPTYKVFKSDDYTGIEFFVIATNKADFMTANLTEGYFTIEFRMNAPFPYTADDTDTHDLTTNPTTTDITVTCGSNVDDYFYPILNITLKGSATGVTIVNLSDGSREFSITGLDALEELLVHNEKKQIISDTGEDRYDGFNKNWLRLVYGANTLRVTGTCVLEFNERYPVFV